MSNVTPQTENIRGMGEVITSPEFFSDFDNVGSHRLSRRSVASTPDDEDDAPAAPKTAKGWQDKPSVADQSTRFPDTVRFGPSVTRTYNLSVTAELAAFNDLQALTKAAQGSELIIQEMEREFYAGSWYVVLTYAKLQYQKL